MNAVVFGATPSAKALYDEIKINYNIIAYCDNDRKKWGEKMDCVEVISPADLMNIQWDEIIIISLSAMEVIRKQLLSLGIEESKINTRYIDSKIKARKQFVVDFAKIAYYKKLEGCVAEAGVFQGEFASVINENFPDRKLYLFDTFAGFDERDIKYEETNKFSDAEQGHLNITSPETVLNRMSHRDQCVIRAGYFPETVKGIKEVFLYVNLDMDLYKPTLEGLRFFYPLMVQGGIITVHDFFSAGYEGVNAAVWEFIAERKEVIVPFPIGDHISIAIQKGKL